MSCIVTHRLVSITAHWSLDHWLDLPAAERRRPVPRSAPGSYSIMLSALFPGLPTPTEIAAALAATNLVAQGYEGRAALRSHALPDRERWDAFIAMEGPDVEERIGRAMVTDSPPITFFRKLAHARQALGGDLPIPSLSDVRTRPPVTELLAGTQP